MIQVLLDKKEIFDSYKRKVKGRLACTSFVSLYAFKDFFHFDFDMIDGNLCIFASDAQGTFLYLPPLGEQISPKAIRESFRRMDKANIKKGMRQESLLKFSRIENAGEEALASFPDQEFERYQKSFEICYQRADIAALAGNRFKSKRSDYNYFVKHYSYAFLSFDPSMLEGCLSLYRAWASERKSRIKDDLYRHMLDENLLIHQTVIEKADSVGLYGYVVFVDGVLKAYTFGYPLTEDTFCVLLEVADLAVKGLPVYIFRSLAESRELKHFKFINVMDSLGMSNVERTKLSYRPCTMLPAYVITRKFLTSFGISSLLHRKGIFSS